MYNIYIEKEKRANKWGFIKLKEKKTFKILTFYEIYDIIYIEKEKKRHFSNGSID